MSRRRECREVLLKTNGVVNVRQPPIDVREVERCKNTLYLGRAEGQGGRGTNGPSHVRLTGGTS